MKAFKEPSETLQRSVKIENTLRPGTGRVELRSL